MRVVAAFAILLLACQPAGTEDLSLPESSGKSPQIDQGWPASDDYQGMLQLTDSENDPKVTELVDSLLNEALEGVTNNATPREKVLHLTWFIYSKMKSQNPDPLSMRTILEQRSGQCAATSLVMHLLARRLGLPTRGVGLFGVPIQAAHTALEVYWSDKWHYIDPSFGVYITADGTQDGEILDFDTVYRLRHFIWTNAFYATGDGRLGFEYDSPKPKTLAELFSTAQSSLKSSGDYRLFLPNTKSGSTYELGKVARVEFKVNLVEDKTFEIGAVDSSPTDIQLHKDLRGYYDSANLFFVGSNHSSHGPYTQQQLIKIEGLIPGEQVRWTTELLMGSAEELGVTSRKTKDAAVQSYGSTVTFEATARRHSAEILLEAPIDQRVVFDFQRFERITPSP